MNLCYFYWNSSGDCGQTERKWKKTLSQIRKPVLYISVKHRKLLIGLMERMKENERKRMKKKWKNDQSFIACL
jgi:hypothetical protein